MEIYAAISIGENAALTAAVERVFADSNYQVGPGQFLITAKNSTTKEVSKKLGVPNGGVGRVLLLLIKNYTGWHSKDMWEWLAAQSEPVTSKDSPSSEVE